MVPDPAQGGKDGVPEEGIPPGYTERTLEHLLTPRNLGMIPEPDGHALFTGPCGDTVEVFLQVADEQIEAASFLFHGCQHTLICGDAACELVKGKPVKEFDEGWSNQFHVWRMDWDQESIKLYVDGQLLNTTSLKDTINADGKGKNPFKQPHYIILNLAIGGNSGGDPSKTKFPSRYEIDYVRIYQK